MNKRPSLAESMRQAATEPVPAAVVAPPSPAPHVIEAAEDARRPREFFAATRAGKKKVTGVLSPEEHKRLRQLALDRDTKVEALVYEAIIDLFSKHRT